MYSNVDAVVLAAEKLGETDRRLTLYTRERGRLYARAAGAARGRLASATEPGVRAAFRLWLPEGGVSSRVTGGGVTSVFPGARREWPRLVSALFVCEWADRMTPLAHAHPEKFDLLVSVLAALERHDPAVVRAAYLLQFVRLAGYGPGQIAHSPLVQALDEWDFAAAPPAVSLPEALAWEDQIVKAMAPLLVRPIKTLAQLRSLAQFMRRRMETPR